MPGRAVLLLSLSLLAAGCLGPTGGDDSPARPSEGSRRAPSATHAPPTLPSVPAPSTSGVGSLDEGGSLGPGLLPQDAGGALGGQPSEARGLVAGADAPARSGAGSTKNGSAPATSGARDTSAGGGTPAGAGTGAGAGAGTSAGSGAAGSGSGPGSGSGTGNGSGTGSGPGSGGSTGAPPAEPGNETLAVPALGDAGGGGLTQGSAPAATNVSAANATAGDLTATNATTANATAPLAGTLATAGAAPIPPPVLAVAPTARGV